MCSVQRAAGWCEAAGTVHPKYSPELRSETRRGVGDPGAPDTAQRICKYPEAVSDGTVKTRWYRDEHSPSVS